MAGGKLEGSHNTRVDCEPGVAMAGLKQELGCHGWQHHWGPWLARSRIWDAMAGSSTGGHGWPVAGSGMPWLASITEGHGWPVAGSGNAMAGNVTGDHRI